MTKTHNRILNALSAPSSKQKSALIRRYLAPVRPGVPVERRLFLKGAALGLLGLTVFGIDSPAFAAKASDETLSALSSAQAAYETAMSDLQAICTQLEEADYRLAECQANLDATNQEIADLEASILQNQSDLAAAQDVLAERVGANYKAGTTSLLEVLLDATSFEDFVSRLYYAGKVTDSDAEAIQTVKDIKATLEAEEQELQTRRTEQEQLVADQQAYSDELSSTVAYYEEYVAGLSSDVTALMAQAQAELAASQQAEYEAYLAAQAAAAAAEQSLQAQQTTQPSDLTTQESAQETPSQDTWTDTSTEDTSWTPDTSTDDTYEPSYPEVEDTSYDSWGYSGGNHVPEVVSYAWSFIGVPYVWGGTDPSGFDCSGLAQYCYAMAGYSIPRTTYSQIAQISALGQLTYNLDDLQAGDLLFPHSGHVGIYCGDGCMIHAPYEGETVKYIGVYAFTCGGCPV